MRARWLAVALVLAIAPPIPLGEPQALAEGSQPLLARPDALVTLRVAEVDLPALLVFLARVGGSDLAVEAGITGSVRDVRFEQARAEDAFEQLLRDRQLVVKQVGGKLLVTHGEAIKPPVPPIAPAPARPELIVPPKP
jgi:hypothetical protein